MNIFDSSVLDFVNHFSRLSWSLDLAVVFISGNDLLKGGVLLALFWWGWFKECEIRPHVRMHLISTLFSCFLAMLLARVLALLLPFRFRPLHDEAVEFLAPYGMWPRTLEGWSSFPSDHAALFFALATGMFFISRKAGIFALVYTTLFIGLPRVYTGLHYPTDIIAGGLLGVTIALLCNLSVVNNKISRPVLLWSGSRPQLFYPLMFLLTSQIAELFSSSREFFGFIYSMF